MKSISNLRAIKKIPFLFWTLLCSLSIHIFLISHEIVSIGHKPAPPSEQPHLVVTLKENVSVLTDTHPHKAELKAQTPNSDSSTTTKESPASSHAVPERYYEAKELDTLPNAVNEIKPQLPLATNGTGVRGEVHLELFIDEHGAVTSLQILKSTNPTLFDQPVRNAFQTAIFNPGIKNSTSVKSHILIVVRFEQENFNDPN